MSHPGSESQPQAPRALGWLDSLSPVDRETVFAEMRRIGESLDSWEASHRRLSPRNGEIPVGGAHMDPFFKAEGLRVFLGGLRSGTDPAAARGLAIREVRAAVAKWNASREWQVRKWIETSDMFIFMMSRELVLLADRIARTGSALDVA